MASHSNVSFYKLHASKVDRLNMELDRQGRPRLEQGSGIVEYPPFLIAWMSFPIRVFDLYKEPSSSLKAQKIYDCVLRASLAIADLLSLCCLTFLLHCKLLSNNPILVTGILIYAASGACLYALIYDRSDMLVGFAIALTIVGLISGWPYWCTIGILVAAINLKIVAFIIAPICVLGYLPCKTFQQSIRVQVIEVSKRLFVLIAFICISALVCLYIYGPECYAFFRYHSLRGVQLESLPATVILLVSDLGGWPVTVEHAFGSTNLASSGAFQVVLCSMLVGCFLEFVVLVRFWKFSQTGCKKERNEKDKHLASVMPETVIQSIVLMLIIAILSAKVFSPQYLLWLIGIVPAVRLNKARKYYQLQSIWFLVLLATMTIYPLRFDKDVRPVQIIGFLVEYNLPTAFGLLLLVVRNSLLVVLAIQLWQAIGTERLTERMQSSELSRS